MVGLLNEQLEIGAFTNINKPQVTIINTYKTLGGSIGLSENIYSLRNIGFGIKLTKNHYLAKTNFFIGGRIYAYKQSPLNPITTHIEGSDAFMEVRNSYNDFGFSGSIGYKHNFNFSKNGIGRLGFQLEARSDNIKLKSENFEFNVFGNADRIVVHKNYHLIGFSFGVVYYIVTGRDNN